MKKAGCFLLLVIATIGSAGAQDLSVFEKKLFLIRNDTMPYRILLPKGYNPKKKYPLIVFLHGAGERGRDNERQLIHGSKLFIKDNTRNNFPAIVVLPQCPPESYWSNQVEEPGGNRVFNTANPPTKAMQLLMQFVNKMIHDYPLKMKQLYVGGLSMGGMGTFELVARRPGLFAAAFPICGGGDPAFAKEMKSTSWWIFHGEKDDVVWPRYSKQMEEALKKEGAKVTLTLYPEANHNSWDRAFAEPELLPWLFAQQNKKRPKFPQSPSGVTYLQAQ